jgi:hypothetical protein
MCSSSNGLEAGACFDLKEALVIFETAQALHSAPFLRGMPSFFRSQW